jgi:hypothetical protein
MLEHFHDPFYRIGLNSATPEFSRVFLWGVSRGTDRPQNDLLDLSAKFLAIRNN